MESYGNGAGVPALMQRKLRQGYVLHFATRVRENPFKAALVSQLADASTAVLAEGRGTRGRCACWDMLTAPDDDADLFLVKGDYIWKLPSWAEKT